MWLQDNCDGTAYFPQEGHFHLERVGVPLYAVLIVEGPEIRGQGTTAPRQPLSMTVTTPTSGPLPPPVFKSVISTRKGPAVTLKVVKASLLKYERGKPMFQPLTQMFLDLTDATANPEYIQATISSQWGPEYTIVSNDGLEIEDSPATRSTPAMYGINWLHPSVFRYLLLKLPGIRSANLILFFFWSQCRYDVLEAPTPKTVHCNKSRNEGWSQ